MNNSLMITDKRRMEEMLADYAFGRLSEDEKAAFEYSMPNFPDIGREVEEVRKVFDRVSRTDFEDYYDRRSRNLSVNVLRRMENNGNIRRTFARLVPILGMAVALIAFVVWQKPAILDDEADGRHTVAQPLAATDNYAAEILLDDEIAEAIGEFVPNNDIDLSAEVKSSAEMLTTISAPLNESFLEEQISVNLSDSDLSNILENGDDESTL